MIREAHQCLSLLNLTIELILEDKIHQDKSLLVSISSCLSLIQLFQIWKGLMSLVFKNIRINWEKMMNFWKILEKIQIIDLLNHNNLPEWHQLEGVNWAFNLMTVLHSLGLLQLLHLNNLLKQVGRKLQDRELLSLGRRKGRNPKGKGSLDKQKEMSKL